MARVLNVSSAYNPRGGTIAKLRALMRSSIHKHYLYHPGYNKNKDNILRELPYYSTIGVNWWLPQPQQICSLKKKKSNHQRI